MNSTKYIFLRNDDVRDSLDDGLIALTTICLKHDVPISHAVEPANVSEEVASWLISMKSSSPDMIEIIQHGFDHNKNNPNQKFEFGGRRTYSDQLESIREGKRLMNFYFGKSWFPIFTFPYGAFNTGTLNALKIENYKGISSKIDFSTKSQLKNFLGKSLNKDFILGKKINYHPKIRKKYGFQELSVSANLIKSYIDKTTATHYTLEEVEKQISDASKHTSVIGVLFHHRFHSDQISTVERLIMNLKSKGYTFSTLERLYMLMHKNTKR
jgi:peptidoglycan/xylan/chitin deacetylase (PgdA/CDA1 family)